MTDYNIGNLVAGFKFDKSGLDTTVANVKKGMGDMSSATTGVKGAVASLSASFTALMANPIALAAAAVSGLVAAGKAAFDASEKINSAYDDIRVGTGATEEALAGLQESFNNVYGNYAAETDDVATAIADLNTRLGLTGKPLEELSTQFLALNRMMGIDISSAIESASKAFQSWGVAAEDYGTTLDTIFRASQATGATVEALAESLGQNGATFRTLGFTIEEAAAMLGTFEKEGINSASVLSSLQIALRTFAAEGVTDASEALNQVIDSIQNASSSEGALTLATDVFGRSATEMVDAIRSGRFEFDELTAAIQNTDETIMTADAATTGFAERFQTLGNKITLALTPMGSNIEQTLDVVFKGLNWIADEILPGLVQAYTDFISFYQSNISKLVQPFLNFFSKVGDTFKKFWKGNEDSTASAISVIAGRISELMDGIGTALDWVLTTIWPAVELWIEQLVNLISLAASLITGDWDNALKALQRIAAVGMKAIYAVMEWAWNGIAEGIEHVLQGIVNGFFDAMNSVVDVVENAINGLADMWNGSWLAELTGWQAGHVYWHLDAPDVPELLKFGDSGIGQAFGDKIDSLIDSTETESKKTNSVIDTGTGKIDSTLQSGFAGLNTGLDSLTTSVKNMQSSAVQNIQQATSGTQNAADEVVKEITSGTKYHYDSSGNPVNGYWSLAGATLDYLPDGRLVITTEDGKKYVHKEKKIGDSQYGITGAFNAPDASYEGVMTRIKQDEAERAQAMAQKGSSSGSSSGVTVGSGLSSSKPSISAVPDAPAKGSDVVMMSGPNAGQTVNITVNGDVSTPSSFAQAVSNIANALSKPLISWFV